MKLAKLPEVGLDGVRVAADCPEPWDCMGGNDLVRFCGRCGRSVYDLAAMDGQTTELLMCRVDGQSELRLHWRADGKVQTADCPVGLKSRRRVAFQNALHTTVYLGAMFWLGFSGGFALSRMMGAIV